MYVAVNVTHRMVLGVEVGWVAESWWCILHRSGCDLCSDQSADHPAAHPSFPLSPVACLRCHASRHALRPWAGVRGWAGVGGCFHPPSSGGAPPLDPPTPPEPHHYNKGPAALNPHCPSGRGPIVPPPSYVIGAVASDPTLGGEGCNRPLALFSPLAT